LIKSIHCTTIIGNMLSKFIYLILIRSYVFDDSDQCAMCVRFCVLSNGRFQRSHTSHAYGSRHVITEVKLSTTTRTLLDLVHRFYRTINPNKLPWWTFHFKNVLCDFCERGTFSCNRTLQRTGLPRAAYPHHSVAVADSRLIYFEISSFARTG